MSYRIVDNSVTFEQNTIQKASIFLRAIAEEVVSSSQSRTPKDKGNLRRDVLKSILGLSGKIKWDKNYAAYQEEKQFKNYTTPGTGPHYARNAIENVIRRSDAIAKRVGLI